MVLSLPPPTHKLVTPNLLIEQPWYRYMSQLTTAVNTSGRTVLTEDTTFYVRTTGSDTVGDGSENTDAKAFATPRGAYDYICRNVDCAGYLVTIQMAAGTYTEVSQTRPNTGTTTTNVIYIGQWPVGGTGVKFTGDTATPSNVIWSGNPVWIGVGGYYVFEGMKWQSITGIGGSSKGLFCNASGATIIMGAMDYGTFGSSHFHIYGPNIIKCFTNYTISGSANRHIWLEGGCSSCDWEGHTVTLTGTPAFGHSSGAFIMVEKDSSAFILDVVFSGAATGPRFFISDFATIDTADTNQADLNDYFPGDSAGTVVHRATGSQRTAIAVDNSTTTAFLQYQALARDNTAGTLYGRYSNDAYGPHIAFLKGRSSSIGGTTVPSSGDELGVVEFCQVDTSGSSPAAGIRALCGGTAAFNDAPGNLEFGTTADGAGSVTWRWRVDLNGHLSPLTDNTYDVGTSSAGVKKVYVGSGGTGLDFFSQGSWTPGLNFNGAGTGITYATQVGSYVRVGNMVTLWGTIVLTSNGSATGSAQIVSLPYAVVTETGYQSIGTLGNIANITAPAGGWACPFTYLESADTRIDLKTLEADGTETWFTDTEITDTAEFSFTISYRAA